LRFGHNLRMMAKHVGILRGITLKMHDKNYRKCLYTTITTKMLQARTPSEAWPPSYWPPPDY